MDSVADVLWKSGVINSPIVRVFLADQVVVSHDT